MLDRDEHSMMLTEKWTYSSITFAKFIPTNKILVKLWGVTFWYK